MHRFLVVAVVVGWLLPAAPATARPAPSTVAIVKLRPAAGDPEAFAARTAARFAIPVRHVYHAALLGFAAPLTPGEEAVLAADPAVEAVTADRPVKATGQIVPSGIRRIHADPRAAGTAGATGTPGQSARPGVDVNVAVLDSGIDASHPDLNVVGGTNCIGGRRFDDDYGHGTHIAGIIGALDNTIGVVGVAPGARLWGVKVLDDQGNGTVSDLLCGVDWVTATRFDRDRRNDIAVANLSVGGEGSDDGHCGNVDGDLLHKAICRSVAAGTTYVAAAGNDHTDASALIPAAYREVITVSALADSDGRAGGVGGAPSCRPSEQDDTLASFSNYGKAVDMIAPGVCILSTLPVQGRNGSERDAYGVLSGTSFAAPHVAGAAAVWVSRHPGATPADVRAALVAAGSYDWDDRGDPDGVQEPLVDVSRF
jgi:subtilisin family serine protease